MKRTKEIVEQLIAEGYTYKGHSPEAFCSDTAIIRFGFDEYVTRARGEFHNRKPGGGVTIDQSVVDKVIEVANSK